MRPLILLACCCLATTACQKKTADIDIPTARTRAALALTAFECSHLAPAQAETSRLFNLGVSAGRDFLGFAEANPNGYQSIQAQVDPVWHAVQARPSVDFRLGELYALSTMKVAAQRERWPSGVWEEKRQALYAERNCAFIVAPPPKP